MTMNVNGTLMVTFNLSDMSARGECLPDGPLMPAVELSRRPQCIKNTRSATASSMMGSQATKCTDGVYSAVVTVPKFFWEDTCVAVIVNLGDGTRKITVVTFK
jgi:hypothetical protein